MFVTMLITAVVLGAAFAIVAGSEAFALRRVTRAVNVVEKASPAQIQKMISNPGFLTRGE